MDFYINTEIINKLNGYFTLSTLPFLLLTILYFMKKDRRNNLESILLLFFSIMFIANLLMIINFLRNN
jgi:hypothetical protein